MPAMDMGMGGEEKKEEEKKEDAKEEEKADEGDAENADKKWTSWWKQSHAIILVQTLLESLVRGSVVYRYISYIFQIPIAWTLTLLFKNIENNNIL